LSIFPNLPFILSLYIIGQLITLPGEKSVQSPVICFNSHYSIRRLCTYKK